MIPPSDTLRILQKRIENYEGNRVRELKKALIFGGFPMFIFLLLGTYIVGLGGYILGSALAGMMVFMVYTYIKEINEFRKRKTIHKLFFSELHTKDNIEVILEKSLYIQPIIEKALKQKRLFEKTRLRINYFDNLLQYLLLILTDLRSDLQIRLIEKQQTLKKAEVEIENNIYGTPELSQVSELQMARLDREIEQFEELQRVLVKV